MIEYVYTLFLIPPETCKVAKIHVRSHSSRIGAWDFEYQLQQQRFDLHLCILIRLVCLVLLAHMYAMCPCQFSIFLYGTVGHDRHVHLLYSLASVDSVNVVNSVYNKIPNLIYQILVLFPLHFCFHDAPW